MPNSTDSLKPSKPASGRSSPAQLTVDDQPPLASTRSQGIPTELLLKMTTQMGRLEVIKELHDMVHQTPATWSEEEFQLVEERLEDQHKKFHKTHAHFEVSWPTAHINHAYFSDRVFCEEEKTYLKIRAQLVALKRKHLRPRSSHPKLPDISLPLFSGDYAAWPAYRDMFTSLIIEAPTISDVEKLHYLRSSLSEAPLQFISGLAITGASFPVAWEQLTAQYENKRILITAQLEKFFAPPPKSKHTAASLNNLLTTMKECIHNLEALGQNPKQWDCLLVHFVVRQLDRPTQESWESSLGSSKVYPTFAELMQFLHSKTRSLEWLEAQPSTSSPSSRPARPTTDSNLPSFRPARPTTASTLPPSRPVLKGQRLALHHGSTTEQHTVRYGCDDCEGSHFIVSCPQFRARTAEQRHSVVLRRQLCFNCLGRHNKNNCRSTVTCLVCQQKHHSMIHDAVSKKRISTPSSNSPQVTSTKSAPTKAGASKSKQD